MNYSSYCRLIRGGGWHRQTGSDKKGSEIRQRISFSFPKQNVRVKDLLLSHQKEKMCLCFLPAAKSIRISL